MSSGSAAEGRIIETRIPAIARGEIRQTGRGRYVAEQEALSSGR